jgi:hypothetical protein
LFAESELVKLKPVSGHTHGQSAANRSEASIFIDMLGKSSGHRVVQLQGSSADVRNGRTVTRTWHWPKDLQVDPSSVTKGKKDLLAMVDVDYYVNMPSTLADHVQPTILYTFQPSAVAKESGEYKYTFNRKNEVDYRVAGGGRYVHPLWNYDGDSFSTTKWLCCLPTKYVAYNIERKRVDADHQIVLLTPLAVFPWLTAWLARLHLGEMPLKRLQVVEGEFLRLQTNQSNGLFVHTGLPDTYICNSVPVARDTVIHCSTLTSSVALTLAGVKTKLKDCDDTGAEVLLLYHRTKEGLRKPEVVSTIDEGVRAFQWSDKIDDLDFDVKPSMIAFMQPLYHAAFVPDDCLNNDKRLIDARVTKTRSNVQVTDNVRRRIDEFITMLHKHGVQDLRLCDIDTVFEKQNRPSQKAILLRADHEGSIDKTSTFMKKEAYQKVTDPRNISQINGPDKRDYSRVIYPLSDAIKQFDWYAFGKTPKGVSERVAEICSTASWILKTDFSRMDGRISPAARYFERVLLASVFHEEDVPFVLRVWKTQFGLRGKTKFGVFYKTETSRLSGSPETSAFNTLLTALIIFMSYRATKVDGRYMSVETAFSAVGVAGGDDGLTANLNPDLLARRAADMGQVLTSETVARGDLGVEFLARLYSPDIWFAESTDDISTICDIRRVLHKFHVTARLASNVTPAQKLYDKSYAYHLSDLNTPIIGVFVKRVLQIYPRLQFKNVTNMWNVVPDVCVQYPNNNTDWAWEVVRRDLPDFDVDRYITWITTANTTTIYHAPAFTPAAEPNPAPGIVAVDGDILINQPKSSESATKTPARIRKRGKTRSKRTL